MSSFDKYRMDDKNAAASSVDIKDLVSLSISRWYWFAISVVIALGLATLYILRTPPTYTRIATILVKDDQQGGGLSNVDFSDMGIFRPNSNIQNELLTLKSITTMVEVVERLGLQNSYYVNKGLRKVELYKSSPYNVEVLALADSTKASCSFNFEVKGSDVTLTGFRAGTDKVRGTTKGQLGQLLKTPVGEVVVTRSQWFNKNENADKEILFVHKSADAAARAYVTALKPDLANDDATIINLSIANPSIRKADDILNTLITVHNERWIEDKNILAKSTSKFIDERLAELGGDLLDEDTRIANYKSDNGIPNLERSADIFISQASTNDLRLLELNNQRYMAEYIKDELVKSDGTHTLPASTGISDAAFANQVSQYNTLVLERNRMLQNSSESNPVVITSLNSINSLRNNILQSVDNVIVSLDRQIKSITNQQNRTAGRLSSAPNQAKDLLSLERSQKVKESLYVFLLEKREENELGQAFTAYNTRLIDPPHSSNTPPSPVPSTILFIAFVLGLLFPLGLIFLREMFYTKVRGKKDLEHLSIPIMGEIPQIQDDKHKVPFFQFLQRNKKRVNAGMDDLVVRPGRRDVINEAFRVLRTNLEFVNGRDQECSVVMITSFNPSSGKSLISMNLASSLSLKNKKVLVIDCDLRRASASAFVDSPRKGLSNYLNGSVTDIDSLIVPLPGHEGVDVIPVGTLPPNPSELLGEQLLGDTVNELRSRYDFILLDCPPIDLVADTAVIAKLADRTIFVIRAGLFDRSMLSELENVYHDGRFNSMSVILNGTSITSGKYGYKYGYRYGYGSGYGYGYGEEKK